MKALIRAALGEAAGRLLLVTTPTSLMLHLAERPRTTFVVLVSPHRRALKKPLAQLRSGEQKTATVALVAANLDALPFQDGGFDAVIMAAGRQSWRSPLERLRSLRAQARSGGAVMVVTALGEGPIGGVTSFIKRVARRDTLPRAVDLTAWMLRAGLRKVRQANVSSAVVPTVLTWAEVTARPWEDVLGRSPDEAMSDDQGEEEEPGADEEALTASRR